MDFVLEQIDVLETEVRQSLVLDDEWDLAYDLSDLGFERWLRWVKRNRRRIEWFLLASPDERAALPYRLRQRLAFAALHQLKLANVFLSIRLPGGDIGKEDIPQTVAALSDSAERVRELAQWKWPDLDPPWLPRHI